MMQYVVNSQQGTFLHHPDSSGVRNIMPYTSTILAILNLITVCNTTIDYMKNQWIIISAHKLSWNKNTRTSLENQQNFIILPSKHDKLNLIWIQYKLVPGSPRIGPGNLVATRLPWILPPNLLCYGSKNKLRLSVQMILITSFYFSSWIYSTLHPSYKELLSSCWI